MRLTWSCCTVLALVLAAAGHALALQAAPAARPISAVAPPQRIMSVNQCTDLLLLMLVPSDRIASISWLAHEPVEALMPGADAGVHTNRGTAEEVIRDRPDLILASPWSTPVLRRLAGKVGAPVLEVDAPNSFADIRRLTRQVGAAVGEPARAEALIAQMDRELAELAATAPSRPMRVAVWNGDSSVPGETTLIGAIIRAAGARNIAAEFPDTPYASYSVEQLLVARPDAILRGGEGYAAPSLQREAGGHRIVRKAFTGRTVTYPATLYSCGLPQSATAARQLRDALTKVPAGGPEW